ncbi:MAG: (d)CMP kinase [Prevotella sp.]|nr:(d)CMP kinase [Prevotella sp.]
MKKITIAIDGHSSCGKSTMAKNLAREIGYVYVDTGAMYRAVTLFAMRNNLFNADGSIREDELKQRLDEIHIDQKLIGIQEEKGSPSGGKLEGASIHTFLNGEDVERDIRTMEVSSHVSPIATLPFVREKLVEQQQQMGAHGGIVMDGRDIGTVVFPNAELKIFVTASAEVRAMRRYKELQEKGMSADYDAILKNVVERDRIDSTRAVSPLRKADDAIELDNSNITIAEQQKWLINEYYKAAQ